jgi:transposase
MGERTVLQEALFYSFHLDRHVPMDHLLRSIDRFVDLAGVREHLRPYYSNVGRPSIDPELMIRMLIVGYCFGIRSERRLCDEVHLNLGYRWFCRLSLDACAFRRLQPSIPIETSHRFRLKPAGDSDDPSRVAARVASG